MVQIIYPMKTFSNAKTPDGRVLNIIFADSSSKIRASAFNDQAERFADFIELNKVIPVYFFLLFFLLHYIWSNWW